MRGRRVDRLFSPTGPESRNQTFPKTMESHMIGSETPPRSFLRHLSTLSPLASPWRGAFLFQRPRRREERPDGIAIVSIGDEERALNPPMMGKRGLAPHNGRALDAWQAAKAVEEWPEGGLRRTGPRPAIVAKNIAPLREDGLPRWLGGATRRRAYTWP